ncbi:auxin-responsive protein SAUR71-like [Impatiens glandulifera]|uniref:auxin-responsive protein SAUR71-like n=1 Tax=Impatiens glandulifera TaxID=253017 RepID=UPI001FB0AD51|nr:auxin-responsive protein SAUR71-like [Impatiens glandulifera]
MSEEIGKSNKIRHIAGIKQMIRRWRRKAASSSSSTGSSSISMTMMMMMMTSGREVPADVPDGYVAICVGSGCRRFVVRATYLNHPIFNGVLSQAAEEYGFANHGPLTLPNCDESLFKEMIRFVSRAESAKPAGLFFNRTQTHHQDQQLQRCLAGEESRRPLLHHHHHDKTPIC